MNKKCNRIRCESLEEFDNRFDRWFKMEKWSKYHFLKNFYREYCIRYNLFPITEIVFRKRFKTITEIYSNNNIQNIDDLEMLVDEYYSVKSFKRRLDIRYGEGRGEEYSNLLSLKSFENDKVPQNLKYWTKQGYSEEEGRQKRREYLSERTKIANKASQDLFKNDPEKFRERYKKSKNRGHSYKFWLEKGYPIEEVEIIIKNHYKKSRTSYENFVKKYGEVEGKIRFDKMNERRKQTKIDRYGSYFVANRSSKESLRYFLPIYKKLRKMGYRRDDIVWGIGKNKEFITYDKNKKVNYAYDFVIKSKKFIIEYNSTFWHARNREEWKNPHAEYDVSLKKDKQKYDFIRNSGYKLLIVWSDCLPSVEDVVKIIHDEELSLLEKLSD